MDVDFGVVDDFAAGVAGHGGSGDTCVSRENEENERSEFSDFSGIVENYFDFEKIKRIRN